MTNKTKNKAGNPLLVPLVIVLVILAFFIGLTFRKSDSLQLKSYDIQISPLPTITTETSPTTQYNTSQPYVNTKVPFKSYTLPLSGKTVYCQQNHYDEIVATGNQLLQIKNTIDQLGSDSVKCVETRCKDSSNDFSSQCQSDPNQTDYEACLRKKFAECADGCTAPLDNYKKINVESNTNVENQFNAIINQYCQK